MVLHLEFSQKLWSEKTAKDSTQNRYGIIHKGGPGFEGRDLGFWRATIFQRAEP